MLNQSERNIDGTFDWTFSLHSLIVVTCTIFVELYRFSFHLTIDL